MSNKVDVVWVDSEDKDTYFKKELQSFCKREKNKFAAYHQVDKKLMDRIKNTKFELIVIVVDNKVSRLFFQKLNEIIHQMMAMLKVIIFVCKSLKEVEESGQSDLAQYPFFNSKLVFDSVFAIEEELKKPKVIPPKVGHIEKNPYDTTCFAFEYIKNKDDLKLPLYFNKLFATPKNDEIVKFSKLLKNKFASKNQILNELLDQILYVKTELPIEVLVKYWLRMYTINSPFYKDVNVNLVTRKDNSYDTFIKTCYAALKKNALSVFTQKKLYRGTVLSKKEIKNIQTFLKNKQKDLPACVCYNKGFLSCSLEISIGKRFLPPNPPVDTEGVLIEIDKSENYDKDNPSNAFVTAYSFYDEAEVLFFPFSCFEVNNISLEHEKGKSDYYLIKLSYLGKYKDLVKDDLTNIPDGELAKDLIQATVLDPEKIKKNTFAFDTKKYTDPNYKKPEQSKPEPPKENPKQKPKEKPKPKEQPKPKNEFPTNEFPINKLPKTVFPFDKDILDFKDEEEENKNGIFEVYKNVPKEWRENSINCFYFINSENLGKTIQIFDKNGNNNKDSCLIYFNDQEIDFTYNYIFVEEGVYQFRFFFKYPLINISSMFEKCEFLVNVDLSSFNGSNVRFMNNMFYGCHLLQTIDFSNFNSENVESMSGIFRDCTSLTFVNVSSFYTANVSDMSGMFRNCTSLTNLDLSNFELININDISYMFFGCTNLKELNINNFNSKNNPDMSWMFENFNPNCKVICKDKEIINLINS